MPNKCLICYKALSDTTQEYHKSCSKKLFGHTTAPILPYAQTDMLQLAEQIIKSQTTVTGVQAKLSLGLQKSRSPVQPDRLTIMGVLGNFILKPATENYPFLPEVEDLSMHLASIAKINTVPHGLIRLQSGKLAYITRRGDRIKGKKRAMEDMCQLTERMTEHKYMGSHEQVAKVILKYSSRPGFDAISFYEQVVFSFLIGNNDMHLKNFSLLKNKAYELCPAYDMVASSLFIPEDDEELALTLNGKKKKLKRKDFEQAMVRANIAPKAIENIFLRFQKVYPKWMHFIEDSFLPTDMIKTYKELINNKMNQLNLILKEA